MRFDFDTSSVDDYETFLKIRRLPLYRFRGSAADVPDEYAADLGIKVRKARSVKYEPIDGLFDYQRDIARKELR